MNGYYVETWGAGRYGSVAWYATHSEAQAHVDRLLMLGYWQGMKPRITT